MKNISQAALCHSVYDLAIDLEDKLVAKQIPARSADIGMFNKQVGDIHRCSSLRIG